VIEFAAGGKNTIQYTVRVNLLKITKIHDPINLPLKIQRIPSPLYLPTVHRMRAAVRSSFIKAEVTLRCSVRTSTRKRP
jgi:hypothetical protein